MRMKKIASRLYYHGNNIWKRDNSFYKSFYTGEFEGKRVNYIIVNTDMSRIDKSKGRIKYYFSNKLEREGKVILRFTKEYTYIECIYDKNSKEITISIKTWFGERFIDVILKRLIFYHKKLFGAVNGNVEWISIHDMIVKDGIYIGKINLYNVFGNMISIYLFRGKNRIYLDNIIERNRDISIKSREKYLGMIEKQYKIVKKKIGKGKYSAGDLEAFGGLKVRAVSTVNFVDILRKRSWKNVRLRIPKSGELVIKEKGYDMAGSVVFKCVLLVPRYPYIRQVFLVGKEYTGQWWMHSVPPEYWKKSLAECERWVLNLRDGDVVVQES
ncbi:MAG: hypothetical protein QXV17_11595 [Candidatus Micrarchaeaceae archaeon]